VSKRATCESPRRTSAAPPHASAQTTSASHSQEPPTSHSRSAHHPCSQGISISNYHRQKSATHASFRSLARLPVALRSSQKRYRALSELTVSCTPAAMTDRVLVGSNKSPSNPTPLSAPQEQQVRDLYYKNVRAKCAEEIESALEKPLHSRFGSRQC
jgi:hypothetical protein